MKAEEREEAIEQTWQYFCGTYYDNYETIPVLHRTAIQMGFDAGAASVDRVEIVKMFEAITGRFLGAVEERRLDEYIAAMEKGK